MDDRDHQQAQVWVDDIGTWARELGFSQIGISGVDLASAEPGLLAWLQAGFHGSMDYMAQHGLKRARPAELLPGTVSVVTARMAYLPQDAPGDWVQQEWQRLQDPQAGVVSVYARGRDYHKVLRQRLQRLAERMAQAMGPLGARVFCDSAPVLEVELAQRSGLGWRGKHTLLVHPRQGSLFFLGEIFVDRWLPPTPAAANRCGRCRACLDVCPTGAIVAPYRLDARRCISYLTIEHAGPIPLELRPRMGQHVYGCDDCQLACPWNKFAVRSPLPDFAARPPWTHAALAEGLLWREADFLRHTEGSPIRRIGWERWQRNLAVAAGNALARLQLADPASGRLRHALVACQAQAGALVQEHIAWALAQGAAAVSPPPPAAPAGPPSTSGSAPPTPWTG